MPAATQIAEEHKNAMHMMEPDLIATLSFDAYVTKSRVRRVGKKNFREMKLSNAHIIPCAALEMM